MSALSDFDPDLASRDELLAAFNDLQVQRDRLTEALGFSQQKILQEAFGVQGHIAKLLVLLSHGRPMTVSALMSGLWADQPDFEPSDNNVKGYVSRARLALAPFGVVIGNVWGGGYVLELGAATVRAAMAGEKVLPLGSEPEFPAGRLRRPFGSERANLLGAIHCFASEDGVARFTSREIARHAALRRPVSDTMRRLEADKQVMIVDRPAAHHPGSQWQVRPLVRFSDRIVRAESGSAAQ